MTVVESRLPCCQLAEAESAAGVCNCAQSSVKLSTDMADEREAESKLEPRVRYLLYTSHFCAAWGERSWEFGASLLLLAAAGGDSLALTSAFGAAECAAMVFFGGLVGSYIDKAHPLRGPLMAFLVQNVSIAVSAAFTAMLLSISDLHHATTDNLAGRIFCIIGVIVFGAIARLGSLGSTLSVEKGWAVALTRGMHASVLAHFNGSMRRIDLCCKILAPISVGVLIDNLSGTTAAIWIAVFNLAAWGVEAYCLKSVFSTHEPCFEVQEQAADDEAQERSPICSLEKAAATWDEFKYGWVLYLRQTCFLAALGLALLYFTVTKYMYIHMSMIPSRG